MVGDAGNAPAFSRFQTWRISFFLIPVEPPARVELAFPGYGPGVIPLYYGGELVGNAGNAPAFSTFRTWRISFFLVPEFWSERVDLNHRLLLPEQAL